jgi:hypothetical protein
MTDLIRENSTSLIVTLIANLFGNRSKYLFRLLSKCQGVGQSAMSMCVSYCWSTRKGQQTIIDHGGYKVKGWYNFYINRRDGQMKSSQTTLSVLMHSNAVKRPHESEKASALPFFFF